MTADMKKSEELKRPEEKREPTPVDGPVIDGPKAKPRRPLSLAQIQHIMELNGRVLGAQAAAEAAQATAQTASNALSSYVSYLRTEHNAPAESWELYNIYDGFEPRRNGQGPSEGDNGLG